MKIRTFILMTAMVALSAQAFGAAIIATDIYSGDPSLAGTQFTIRIAVTSNDTGKDPIAFSGRVNYATNSVNFVSFSEGELGSIIISDEEEKTTPEAFRDILTTSMFPSPGSTPVCCYITFQVLASPVTPFSIILETDPENATLTDESFAAFAASEYAFDNSGTTNIGEVEVPSWSLY